MIEPEMAFADLEDDMRLAEDMIKYIISYVLENAPEEMAFFNQFVDKELLARLDGVDTTGGNVWYETGMAWAVSAGISDGTDPDLPITREQLATMLWRYAGRPAGRASLDRFPDAGTSSSYAEEALRWAVDGGVIHGMEDGTLTPQGTATRAQVATMLMRFCQLHSVDRAG